MSLRLAHVTDIHWQTAPRLGELTAKRWLGTANLYLRGRRHHFDRQVQDALVAHLLAVEPDAVVVTGDLTAQALDAEFALARTSLQPVLDAYPTLVLPGNHDAYTADALREARLAKHFGPWLHRDGPIARLDIGPLTLIGLDPNAPRLFRSHGELPADQLSALADALADPALADRAVVLALHYPVVGRDGGLYDGWNHGLVNAADLVAVLAAAPVAPQMVLHGHVHHGYRAVLPLEGRTVHSFDPGSSGYAWMPDRRRAAGMNVYTVSVDADPQVERYLYSDGAFTPEPGGAYATGR